MKYFVAILLLVAVAAAQEAKNDPPKKFEAGFVSGLFTKGSHQIIDMKKLFVPPLNQKVLHLIKQFIFH